jgi:hypothetical protein
MRTSTIKSLRDFMKGGFAAAKIAALQVAASWV